MKNSTKIALISAFTAFTMIGAAASTVAWFSTTLGINIDENLTGESNGAYFADGDGSEERPFIINRPVHLYNLAWLQYLGYFNNNTIGAASGPTYFEIDENLEGSLDMDGWYLPPIGTTLNPFVGIFNGNGKTVANLTTINSSSPATYKKSPYPVRQANVVSNVNVLGMFGVVGECGLTGTGVTSLYPAAGYEGNQISNFYINNGHVENYQSSTIAGIAAGYVNAPLSGVGISTTDTDTPSSIDLTNSTNPTVYGGKTNISDFTSVGYCEDEYKETVLDEYVELYDPSSSQILSGFVAQNAGNAAGWGGSIDMMAMYNRILRMAQKTNSVNGDIHNTYDNNVLTNTTYSYGAHYYYNKYQGSFYLHPRSGTNKPTNGQYNFLGGGVYVSSDYYNVNLEDHTGYYIYNGNNYLSHNGTTLQNDARVNADVWTLSKAPADGSTTTISTKIGDTTYYLRYSSGLQLSSSSYNWTYEANGDGFRLKNGNRYLRYYNNNWTTTTYYGFGTNNATTLTFESATIEDYEVRYLDHSDTSLSYNTNYFTCFPLTVDEDSSSANYDGVVNNNTGYVVGGSNYRNGNSYPTMAGDIRVSYYSLSNLSNSYSTSKKDFTTIYTVNASGSVNATVPNTGHGFERYDDSKPKLLKTLQSGSNFYGLHFMDALISEDNLITTPYALINGKEYENYQMPVDCIDFNLKEKGYVNFFAGTYWGGTGNVDSFFSLHKITRNADNSIASIDEISEILSDDNPKHDYIYKYTDGTYSSADRTGYSSIFNTSRIKLNTLTQKRIYYFEIPINDGEYALGSVENSNSGAYLLYLDIGANATTVYRSTVIELIHTIAEEFSRPLGIGIVVAGTTSFDDANSYCITIKSEYSGVVTVARASATAASYTESVASGSSNGVFLSYSYEQLSVNTDEEAIAVSKVEQTIKRVTYFDYIAAESATTKTVLSSTSTVTTLNGGTPSTAVVTYDTKQYKNYTSPANGTEVTVEDDIVVFKDDGSVLKSTDYETSTFFNGYASPTNVANEFSVSYAGVGTITATFDLTSNSKTPKTDSYDLFSARGYTVTIWLTDEDTTTNITADCTFFAYDGKTYVVDSTTGQLLLVIHDAYIENDVTPSA